MVPDITDNITWAPNIRTPPIMAYIRALLASVIFVGFPCAITYLNPARIIKKTISGTANIIITFNTSWKKSSKVGLLSGLVKPTEPLLSVVGILVGLVIPLGKFVGVASPSGILVGLVSAKAVTANVNPNITANVSKNFII